MMAAPIEDMTEAPVPPPRRRLEARLVIAQDIVLGIGIIAGIFVSGISLYLLIRKYRRPAVPPQQEPG